MGREGTITQWELKKRTESLARGVGLGYRGSGLSRGPER